MLLSLSQRLARSRHARRLLRALVVGLFVSINAFLLMRLIPGDPARAILGDFASPDDVANLRRQLGFDGSLLDQLGHYLGGLLNGDLGHSLSLNQPVTEVILHSLPVTLWLMLVTLVLTTALAVPLGLLVAIKRGTVIERLFVVIASASVATPVFFASLILILLFAIVLGVLPVAGYNQEFPDNLRYLVLPALAMGTTLVPVMARVVLSSVSRTLDEEFVETALVHGVPRWTRLWKYTLRPSLAPTIALASYIFAEMLGAAVLVQVVFGLPGIGSDLVTAVGYRDYPLVQGIVAFLGVAVVFVTYAADLVSAAVDPRMRLGGS